MNWVRFRWSRWLSRAGRFNSFSRPRAFRPEVMVLEDRRLLTTNLSPVSAFNAYAGVGSQENAVAGLIGYFPNGQPDLNPSDYQVQINWGEGGDQWAPIYASITLVWASSSKVRTSTTPPTSTTSRSEPPGQTE